MDGSAPVHRDMICVRYLLEEDKSGLQAMLRAVGLARLADDLGDRYWPTLVAVDGADVVGVIEGRFQQHYDEDWCPQGHGGPQGWIFNIVTAADRRGRGVGTALIGKFMDECRAHGCGYVALMVSPIDGEARAAGRRTFFERNGFASLPGGEDNDVFGRTL